MPYKSSAQKGFFRGCAHGMKPKGGRKCPPDSVIDKYENAEQMKRLKSHKLAR